MPYTVGYQWAGDYSRGRASLLRGSRGDLFGSILGGIKGAIKGLTGSKLAPPSFPGGAFDPVPFFRTPDIIPLPGGRRFAGGGMAGGGGGGFTSEKVAETCTIKGHHLNKRGYFTKSRGWIPPESHCVRNRRMNPGNVRALRRGFRRVHSFAKLARSVISFTHRTKLKTRGKRR